MVKFYIQMNSQGPSITFQENKRTDQINIEKENINLILNLSSRFNIETHFITNNKIDTDVLTISPLSYAHTVLMHDKDINEHKNKKLNNVIFFVHNEKELFENILKLNDITYGVIDLKLQYLENYDREILIREFEKILDFFKTIARINERYESEIDLRIRQLSYFYEQQKFTWSGQEFFISPGLKVYYHPNYYYTNNEEGYICDLQDLDFLNKDVFVFTKPHLVCENCNTFYCERDIYFNKQATSEFKVPTVKECERTTFLMHYAKQLWNYTVDRPKLIDSDLNPYPDYDIHKSLQEYENKNCVINQIKKYNFDGE